MDNSLKLLIVLNIADISLTRYLTDLGARELNPIVNYLLSSNFLWALMYKALTVAIFIYFISRLKSTVKSTRLMVMSVNILFVLLVLYQIVGVIVLS